MKFCKISIPKFIFILICFVGCLYHVTKVTEVYFKYQTRVEISLDSQSQIVVPVVTFCREKIYSFKKEANIKQSIKKYSYKSSAAIYYHTLNFSDVFYSCLIKDKEGKLNYSPKCQFKND